jgi:hypothetical protein
VQIHFSDKFRATIGPRTIDDGLVDQSTQTAGPMKIGILNATTPLFVRKLS